MQQAQHARLSFADGKGKRLEHRALQRNPVSRRVHFVFGQFQLAVTDGFVRKELDFLEAHNLRANQNVPMGMGVRRCTPWACAERLRLAQGGRGRVVAPV